MLIAPPLKKIPKLELVVPPPTPMRERVVVTVLLPRAPPAPRIKMP
jgi:hypothetical protein